MVCHRMCDYHHYTPEEEERLTTTVTTTGEMAQGEGSLDKRTTTSSDYIIRLTDRLRALRSKLYGFFSQFRTGAKDFVGTYTPETFPGMTLGQFGGLELFHGSWGCNFLQRLEHFFKVFRKDGNSQKGFLKSVNFFLETLV